MKELPDERTLAELLEMAKSFEDSARNLYLMAEGFAQKYEHKLRLLQQTDAQKSNLPSTQKSVSQQ
jgi:hypothetical protein